MQKKFFSNLALSLSLNLLIKPFSVLVIDAGVQTLLGNEVYGKYFVLLSLTLIFNIFLDFGINNFTIRHIAQEDDKLGNHFNNVIVLRLILFVLYSILVLITALALGYNNYDFYLLFILICTQFLIQTIAFIRSIFAGLHLFTLDTIVSVIDRFLLIVLVGGTMWLNPGKITLSYFVQAQLICYLATLIFAIIILFLRFKPPRLEFNWGYSIGIIRKSAPYAILILLMLLYNRSDAILLRQLHPKGEFQAGLYAKGYRLLDALYMFGMIFAGMLYPMFSRLLHKKSNEIVDLLQLSAKLLIGGSLGIAFIGIVNANVIMKTIYKQQQDSGAESILMWLLLAFTMMSVNFIFGTLLTASGKLSALNRISIFGVLFSIVFNLLFSSEYGAIGCAVVAFGTQALVSCLLYFTSYKNLNLSLDAHTIFRILGVGGFLAMLYFAFQIPMNTGVKFWGSSMICLFAMFVFSIIDVKAIKRTWMLKSETQ
jgi:O-antigen/teichoic acid export membrane protein